MNVSSKTISFPISKGHRMMSLVFVLVILVVAQILTSYMPALAMEPVSQTNTEWPTRDWPNTDFSKTDITPAEIISGGPARDGIPSIDHPRLYSTNDAFLGPKGDFPLDDLEPVIRIVINGDARAYPLRILIWHEVVNDVVGGVPVVVTYCPLCNAALAFERTLNGRTLEFGTSGLLRHSDLVMYDRETESWWQQFTGQAIVGDMVGQELAPVAARIESFQLYKTAFPTGKVLVPNDLTARAYDRTPYARYDAETGLPLLFSGELPPGIPAMARVISVEDKNGDMLAWSLGLIRRQKEIRHGDLVLRWVKGQSSVLDRELVVLGRDVGNVSVQRDQNGTLVDLPHHEAFAFAFHAFHPDSPIFQHLPDAR